MLRSTLAIIATTAPVFVGMVARSAGGAASDARAAIDEAIDARDWDLPGVRDRLDRLVVDELVDVIGHPRSSIEYSPRYFTTWKPGDGKPDLANDDPAVQMAQGICASYRIWAHGPKHMSVPTLGLSLHTKTCDWCSYPFEEVMKAAEWGCFMGRHIEIEFLIWDGGNGSSGYVRVGRTDTFENPEHAHFWELSKQMRQHRIDVAAGIAEQPVLTVGGVA